MMNLEVRNNPVLACLRISHRSKLFFVAADLTNNNTLIDMAISHANKTMQNHVRPDGTGDEFHRFFSPVDLEH